MQPYCKIDDHKWAPIKEWGARYRCEKCKCFGYVPSQASGGYDEDPIHRSNVITPYRCSYQGCNNPGTSKNLTRQGNKTKDWRCWSHAAKHKKGHHDVFCPQCNARSGGLCRDKNGAQITVVHAIRKTFANNFYEYDIALVVPGAELTEYQEFEMEAIANTECSLVGCYAPPGEPCDPWVDEEDGLCHHSRMLSRFGGGVLKALKDPKYRAYWEQTNGAIRRQRTPNVRSTAPRSSKLRTRQKREGVMK